MSNMVLAVEAVYMQVSYLLMRSDLSGALKLHVFDAQAAMNRALVRAKREALETAEQREREKFAARRLRYAHGTVPEKDDGD